MRGGIGKDGSNAYPPREKVLDLSTFRKPVAEVDTSNGRFSVSLFRCLMSVSSTSCLINPLLCASEATLLASQVCQGSTR